MHHAKLLLLALVLSCSVELAERTQPAAGWPDLAAPPIGRRDGRDDAALIVAIEDPALGGRAGAFEVASGWYRYLVETRGLRRRHVLLLRDGQASAEAIHTAVEQLEERADIGSLLWLIYIGPGSSPSDGGEGWLHAADGQALAFVELREALSAGMHESAFMLVDACVEPPPDGRVSGLPAVTRLVNDFELRVRRQLEGRTYYAPVGMSGALMTAVGATHSRVEADLRREAGTVRNTFVITAGVGPECADALADRPWPALAYAGLGALQGWADQNEDGYVSAIELAVYAQSVAAELDDRPESEAPRPQLRAGGVDLILADVHDRWSNRRRLRLAPEALSQTPTSLELASTLLDLQTEDMVAVAPGKFTIGCVGKAGRRRTNTECESDESPARRIELGGYAIDRTEVSWRDYRACVEAGMCRRVQEGECWVWTGHGFTLGAELPAELFHDEYPVMCVNWLEAQTYCAAVGKRLPTEAEWERAARGTDMQIYPWGDDLPTCKHVVMTGCSDFTLPVGTHPEGASPVGALDMSGNVSEWVNDWWAERGYDTLESSNPVGPLGGEVRVVRGGSFYDGADDLRAGYRYGIDPLARLSTVGFRCAR